MVTLSVFAVSAKEEDALRWVIVFSYICTQPHYFSSFLPNKQYQLQSRDLFLTDS